MVYVEVRTKERLVNVSYQSNGSCNSDCVDKMNKMKNVPKMRILFEGEGPRSEFVDIDVDGKGVSRGTWVKHNDDLYALEMHDPEALLERLRELSKYIRAEKENLLQLGPVRWGLIENLLWVDE